MSEIGFLEEEVRKRGFRVSEREGRVGLWRDVEKKRLLLGGRREGFAKEEERV